MPIRTRGDKPPLFCVHGEPLQIAFRIRQDRPLYGVSLLYHPDLGRKSLELPDSIEQYAAIYVDAIRSAQPSGPYYICGYSAGGMIAFEMTRQLQAAGEQVAHLALVEPTVAVGGPADQAQAHAQMKSQRRIARYWTALVESDNRFQILTENLRHFFGAQLARLAAYRDKLWLVVYRVLDKTLPEGLRWYALIKYLRPVIQNYRYTPFDCRGTLIYAALSDDQKKAWIESWQYMMNGGATFISIPEAVEHLDLMEDPALGQIVEILDHSVTVAR